MTEQTAREAVRIRSGLGVVLLAILSKALAFVREPVVAATLGAGASSDAYYIAIALPFSLYNLVGLPFSLWVTARLAAGGEGAAIGRAWPLYRASVGWGSLGGSLLALGLVLVAPQIVVAYAPGLSGARLEQAIALARVGAIALPALFLQGICGGALFAQHRFVVVYGWLAISGLVGLGGVAVLTPRYGAAAAVSSFVAAWWTAALGLLALVQRRDVRQLELSVLRSADFGPGVIYRAVTLQVFFQGSGLLVYAFASRLPAGGIAATLFASKITAAIYETLVITVGVLVFPRIAQLVKDGDDEAVGRAVVRALNCLIPVLVALIVVLVLSRDELVTLIYHRGAFDERAASLVSEALYGYAPYIVGITVVELLHRAMVLRGRTGGYLLVFAVALLINWLACAALVPRMGVAGVALGSSIGVLSAGIGLWVYARRRMRGFETRPVTMLLLRAVSAASLTLVVIPPLRRRLGVLPSLGGQVGRLVPEALVAGGVFAALVFVMGYRLPRGDERRNGGAAA